ncbi:MAG: NAD(P)H-dependent glycerol-3-phosphate dehydrogenase [bacterium]|nr:NAD(P)H-dependent glycerol-3-phosphate dehydrogenase [bacterium]
MNQPQKVTVLGSGRWGTAMAIFLARKGYEVTLWCFLESEYHQLKTTGTAPNLPGYQVEGRLSFELDRNRSVEGAEVVVVSTPVPFLRATLDGLELNSEQILVTINKGIEQNSLSTVPEIIREYFPRNPLAHLGGPCFPEGLLSAQSPAAETLACEDDRVGLLLQHFFSAPGFRVYRSLDLKGVAILGALKNVYAVIAGIAVGRGMFEEAVAVIVTRGLAEMKRLCEMMGISLETLYGLSGLGDLVLTCYSQASSHNKNFGLRLGRGESTEEILASMSGTVAEGYYTTKAVHQFAVEHGLDLPLCTTAYQVIYQGQPIDEALSELMDRPLKIED